MIMHRRCIYPLMALAVLIFFRGPALAECPECHKLDAKYTSPKSLHDPFKEKDCTSCHQEHGKTGELLLTEEGNALCYQCHEEGDESIKEVHRGYPIGKVSCTSCHQPHASDKIRLLRSNIHRPLAYGECKDCHQENGNLRAKSTALLCYRCHDPKNFQGVSRHEPVASGDCTGCHDAHGSRYPFLLLMAFPIERYAVFSEKTYELCFSCHETESFTVEGGGADTAFKTPSDNLHYRHVFKRQGSAAAGASKEGTTCRNCHLPHNSLRPHLIRENLDCGQGVMCLKLGYVDKEGGGKCTAGCHKAASYGTPKPEAVAYPSPSMTEESKAAEAKALPALEKSFCLECHQKAWEGFQKELIHDPAKKRRCQDCHLDHGSDNRLVLVAYEGRLCERCHELKGEVFSNAHGGLEVGGSHCLACHDPHAANEGNLLKPMPHNPYEERSCTDCHDSADGSWSIGRPINEVCADCHDGQLDHAYLHGAISKDSCTGCHDPHASGIEKLLVARNPGLCYRCHERKNFAREYRHEPVGSGDCSSCHEVHGSDRSKLLVGAYPPDRYRLYNPAEYELCFACHEEGPFMGADASETAFRKGDLNLHSLHVNPGASQTARIKKESAGTTCTNCHEPHATDQPLLIRRTLDCGGVPCLQLEFKKIGESGRCARGCHTPQQYSP